MTCDIRLDQRYHINTVMWSVNFILFTLRIATPILVKIPKPVTVLGGDFYSCKTVMSVPFCTEQRSRYLYNLIRLGNCGTMRKL